MFWSRGRAQAELGDSATARTLPLQTILCCRFWLTMPRSPPQGASRLRAPHNRRVVGHSIQMFTRVNYLIQINFSLSPQQDTLLATLVPKRIVIDATVIDPIRFSLTAPAVACVARKSRPAPNGRACIQLLAAHRMTGPRLLPSSRSPESGGRAAKNQERKAEVVCSQVTV